MIATPRTPRASGAPAARAAALLGSLLCFGAPACSDTAGSTFNVPLTARGSDVDQAEINGWQVQLERADVGFGPLYLCASEVPSEELCETARAELAETVTVDALAPDQSLPALRATTGTVRSALYDYGVSWPLAAPRPQDNPGAPRGHSLLLEGTAERDGERFAFSATLDLTVGQPGRFAAGAATEQRLTADSHLEVTLDPYAWLTDVDFEELSHFAHSAGGAGGAGGTEAAGGAGAETSGGAALILEGSQAYEAIIHAMTAGPRTRFTWKD